MCLLADLYPGGVPLRPVTSADAPQEPALREKFETECLRALVLLLTIRLIACAGGGRAHRLAAPGGITRNVILTYGLMRRPALAMRVVCATELG